MHLQSHGAHFAAGGKQSSVSSLDASSQELTIFDEYEGILFDGTEDQFVVRSEHELHLLQHAITTTRFKMAANIKAVTSTSEVSDTIKSMKTSGPASLDLSRFMLLAVGGAARIHSVLLRTDGSLPVIVVKWQYNKKAHHDRAYHAVKVPSHDGTVLFEHYRPRRTSLKDQPDIAAPWTHEADFAAGRVTTGGGSGHAPQRISQRPSEYNPFEQRAPGSPPHSLQSIGGSGNETPTAVSGPASQAVAESALQGGRMEQRPSEYSFMVEQRPSDDFSALQQRGRVGSLPAVDESEGGASGKSKPPPVHQHRPGRSRGLQR